MSLLRAGVVAACCAGGALAAVAQAPQTQAPQTQAPQTQAPGQLQLPGQPITQTTADGNSSITLPPDAAAASRWSPDVIADAAPMPLPEVDPATVIGAARDKNSRSRVESGSTSPGQEASSDKASSSRAPSSKVDTWPLKFAGKIFFTKPDRSNSWCSAQFVGQRLVLTAAHCVQDGKTRAWHTNVMFHLQYEKGQFARRFGTQCVGTKQAWAARDKNWAFDYAVILVDANSPVGWFGTQWGWQGHSSATKIGYPQGVERGEIIQVHRGGLARNNNIVSLRHGNQADPHGGSGGAWVTPYNTNSGNLTNHAISVSSFVYNDQPGVQFGPYFDSGFGQLFHYVERGCKS